MEPRCLGLPIHNQIIEGSVYIYIYTYDHIWYNIIYIVILEKVDKIEYVFFNIIF